jgi:CRISPR-associated endonuclease/helicase Cas3
VSQALGRVASVRSMGRRIFAHTPNADGEWHLLVDHLRGTAERAASFAEPFGASHFAQIVGWLHDAGKCSQTFAAYLNACHVEGSQSAQKTFRERDHKTPGALRASTLDRAFGPLLAATILGHHGGLDDLTEVRGRLQAAGADVRVTDALRTFDGHIGDAPFPLAAVAPSWATAPPAAPSERVSFRRDLEMLWRLVFSALVDADFLDTEAHFAPDRSGMRGSERALDGLAERFKERRAQHVDASLETPVNRARSEMFTAVFARGDHEPGLYSLAAPTGAGKTQMGLGWALAHARAHGLRRIVTAVPFVTVTDQVAAVYRNLLDDPDDPVILEHHSQVAGDDFRHKLATENWDAPIVVTTTVRLFESMFSNRTSDCRRLHRLARSVIVLDEAQAIPVEVLDPVVDGLRALVDRFGASVLIMTATPPSIEHVRSTLGRRAKPLLPSFDRWEAIFRRTTIEDRGVIDHAAAGAMVAGQRQCLCILNTIHDAREVTAAAGPHVLHLSTRLRPVDRMERLKEIRRRLAQGRDCRVVSTQLVEAGVDLDFPVVMRALAPLPSLTQAEGRCNRNGLLPPGEARTVLFTLAGGKAPPGAYYTSGTRQTMVMLDRSGIDIRDQDAIAEWYRLFLTDAAVSADTNQVQPLRAVFAYGSTARAFRMIDDDQLSIAVPQDNGHPEERHVRNVLHRLREKEPVGPAEARVLQSVTVAIPRRHARMAESQGLAEPVTEHLLEWHGAYDDNLGLMFSPRSMEVLVY